MGSLGGKGIVWGWKRMNIGVEAAAGGRLPLPSAAHQNDRNLIRAPSEPKNAGTFRRPATGIRWPAEPCCVPWLSTAARLPGLPHSWARFVPVSHGICAASAACESRWRREALPLGGAVARGRAGPPCVRCGAIEAVCKLARASCQPGLPAEARPGRAVGLWPRPSPLPRSAGCCRSSRTRVAPRPLQA